MSVDREDRCGVEAGGIDVATQVGRIAPGIVDTRPRGNPDVKPAATSWAGGTEVETESVLGDEGSSFAELSVDRRADVDRRGPLGEPRRIIDLEQRCFDARAGRVDAAAREDEGEGG